MDNEELDKREQQEDEKMKGMLEKDSKKSNKSKFKMIATRLAVMFATQTMLPFIIGIAIVGVILGAWAYLDLEGDNTLSSVATSTLLEDEENVKITNEDGDGGYYFKINKEIKEKYLELINKAYHEGYYDSPNPEPDEDADEFVYDKENPYIKEEDISEWFLTNDYEPYLIKMMRAQIASSYPRLSDYEGESGTEDKVGNKKDKARDYVAQGVAKIQRTKMDEDGNPADEAIPLTYVPYEEFQKMLTWTGEEALEALNYFSFEGELLYYITYQRIVVKVDDEEVSNEIKLYENQVSYKSITSMCSMPYDFLFALLQESENPEWVMKVIDLLLQDTELVLMIQDQMNIRTHTVIETYYHAQMTVTETYTSVGNENQGYHWVSTGSGTPSYTYPVGEPVITKTETITYTNTANVFIKKAKTWCMDFEQEAILCVTETPGEDVVTPIEHSPEEIEGLGYFEVSGGVGSLGTPTGVGEVTSQTTTCISAGTLLDSTTERIDVKDFSWEISSGEKRINYERFLGLWKNEKGEYELDCQFDPNGKKVGYVLPTDNETKSYPVDVIPQENGQRIDELIGLLQLSPDLQMHEELMKYYWNIYMDDDIYDVDIDAILDFMDTNVYTPISGSALSNYIKAWENAPLWKYEIGMSSSFPSSSLSEDEKYYIVYEDGSRGHNNIAYGIATFLSKDEGTVNHPVYGTGSYNWENIFSKYGIDVKTLKTGDLVPVDAVQSAFAEILATFENIVDSYLSSHGIILSQTQRDALVAVCYQRGNILGFAEGYNSSLNANGEVDPELIKNNFYLTANDVKPFEYSSKNDREYANWYLFTEGIYLDSKGNAIQAFGGTILECAKQIHDYMSNPSHLYYYCLAGGEGSSTKQTHISAGLSCGLTLNFSESQISGKKGYRLTCCATYVSWVLNEAGYQVQLSHGATTLSRNLASAGWKKISSYSELQPGDIVFMDTDGVNNGEITHVQIYVGNNTWYNAGNNDSIHKVEPETWNAIGSFVCAYRAPY